MNDVAGVKTENATVWQALNATLCLSTIYPKIVIAVDDDIDPWDLESVFWAVTFRYMPHRDTKIIQGRSGSLDQSSGPYTLPYNERTYPTSRVGPQGASAILMDATRKWEYTPVALPKRHYMERAKEIWDKLGFPPLTPREPWFGRNLGMWPEEYQRQAELGEQGEFEQVANELMKGDIKSREIPGGSSTLGGNMFVFLRQKDVQALRITPKAMRVEDERKEEGK